MALNRANSNDKRLRLTKESLESLSVEIGEADDFTTVPESLVSQARGKDKDLSRPPLKRPRAPKLTLDMSAPFDLDVSSFRGDPIRPSYARSWAGSIGSRRSLGSHDSWVSDGSRGSYGSIGSVLAGNSCIVGSSRVSFKSSMSTSSRVSRRGRRKWVTTYPREQFNSVSPVSNLSEQLTSVSSTWTATAKYPNPSSPILVYVLLERLYISLLMETP